MEQLHDGCHRAALSHRPGNGFAAILEVTVHIWLSLDRRIETVSYFVLELLGRVKTFLRRRAFGIFSVYGGIVRLTILLCLVRLAHARGP